MFNDICCRMTTCYLKNAVNPKILLVVQFRVFAPAMLTRMIGNGNGARETTREKKKGVKLQPQTTGIHSLTPKRT